MTSRPAMRKVVLLQHRLMHYRMGLFEKLRSTCLLKEVALHLVHGQPTKSELSRRDVGHLDWADAVTNRYVTIGGRDILWQPFPAKHRDADLVVVVQENRLLSNYPLLLSRLWSRRKVAYWGHGVNFQSNAPDGLREHWKRMMLKRVDWWFAYTQLTREILLKAGYPDERITVLDNAIDNEGFRADLDAVTDADLAALRLKVGAGETAPIGLFCGSLYPDKRLDFMEAAAARVRVQLPEFQLVVIGDGPSKSELDALAADRPWVHTVGVKRGVEKAAFFKLASVVLNPRLVGLHVLDAFCAGLPMFTTSNPRHGPEIAYLENGKNGVIVDDDIDTYAKAVVALLSDPVRLAEIRGNALAAAERYTLDNMVGNFVRGIEGCLSQPKYAAR